MNIKFDQAGTVPVDAALEGFHPVIQRWFMERLGMPSAPQRQGWPAITAGEDVLIAAPTGSGKTLAAFLAALDALFRQSIEGALEDGTQVVYVSPLKALSNDVQKNLLSPLREIEERAKAEGYAPRPIRVQVRTGDTAASERQGMVRKPPHILVTTPESLYLVLTAARSRETLRKVHTVVVDEIHALARDKRGSHLSLTLERLKAWTRQRPQLVGLSATQKPLERIANFLTGGKASSCRIVEIGHQRPWELSIEIPEEELSAVATHEMWGQVYDRLLQLCEANRTVLIFVNTRKLAERVAYDLGERLGEEQVSAHHGSMSRHLRLAAEEKLKAGKLRAMVATASLELGIDIGSIDLVVQIGSPRAIATALQRIGRAGHQHGGTSKGVLFALTRDELVECTALVRAIREGTLDAVHIPEKPLDILAQQIVAACAADDWDEAQLFALVKKAYPYRHLNQQEFEQVLTLLSEGVATSRSRGRAYLHRNRVNRMLRARRGARISALTNGGAIPDTFTYPVVAEPEGKVVGTLDEDFAVESTAGDIFLLGSTSWRIQSVRQGTVRVENAHGQPPTLPFWLGEAPSRTAELSSEVSRLREDLLAEGGAHNALLEMLHLSPHAAEQLFLYLRTAEKSLGVMPSQKVLVAERFFDEAGGMQLIIHSPFGGRINRAFGLALRKRFCRTFDFELQAAANDDAVLLSLGEQHSFPLKEIFEFLSPESVEQVLTQAVLQSPLFTTRFRWNATRSLSLPRFSMGKRVPPHLQRARTEDLLAAVFPAQVACQDNAAGGDIEIPDHPLVKESLDNCLREALDVDGLKEVLRGIRDGSIHTVAVDLPEPSPLAHQILNSAPYTYLDDAPLEERRARAVSMRRTLSLEDAHSVGALDQAAIAQVIAEAEPPMRDAEELHDAVLQFGLMNAEKADETLFQSLAEARRAARFETDGAKFLVAAERIPHALALFPEAKLSPALSPLPEDGPLPREEAVFYVVRGHMEMAGPVTAGELAQTLRLSAFDVEQALLRLESQGQVLRGSFRSSPVPQGKLLVDVEWCDRRLLQRIHRLTVGRLRKEVEPLTSQDFMRFLFRWHRLDEPMRGLGGLTQAVALLEGYEAPAAAWELALLPLRVRPYLPELLERACFQGELAWGRLSLRNRSPAPGPKRGGTSLKAPPEAQRSAAPTRNANLTFMRREDMDWLLSAARPNAQGPAVLNGLEPPLSHAAKDVVAALERRGASFFQELVSATARLPAEVEDALWELLAHGIVTADAVDNLRVLQSPKRRKRQKALRRGGPGRWSLLTGSREFSPDELLDRVAKLFLRRYGIVFRDLAMREVLAPPWRELLLVYRRMEARGEIRGGRFLTGFAGEQFALPEAVEMARAVRRTEPKGTRIHVSAVDPLNLTGVVTPGPRVSATMGNIVTYMDGVPQEVPETERIQFRTTLPLHLLHTEEIT